jgi:hypothetical protein
MALGCQLGDSTRAVGAKSPAVSLPLREYPPSFGCNRQPGHLDRPEPRSDAALARRRQSFPHQLTEHSDREPMRHKNRLRTPVGRLCEQPQRLVPPACVRWRSSRRSAAAIPISPRATHLDQLLDEALRDTFPASDPIAITIDKPWKAIASKALRSPDNPEMRSRCGPQQ